MKHFLPGNRNSLFLTTSQSIRHIAIQYSKNPKREKTPKLYALSLIDVPRLLQFFSKKIKRRHLDITIDSDDNQPREKV